MKATSELIQEAEQYLYPNYRQPPAVMTRGQGCELWDSEGRRYLDLTAGIAVNLLGHAHPRWVDAVSKQAGTLAHVSNHFYTDQAIELAATLCARTGMSRALFCNSGAEAIEACLKLARRHFYASGQTDRHRVIAFERSFHGRTLGALAATGQAGYREGFGPLSVTTHVPYGDAAAVEKALGKDVAAVLVEPIQGEGGVIPAPQGFLARLRELCDQSGALLLADEIQTGVARTGAFLAVEHSAVTPDAVALAKGLGGGFPIGAMLCGSHLEQALPPGSHGSTFGGNPLAAGTALAVLKAVEDLELIERAQALGSFLSSKLEVLAQKHPSLVTGHRGLGLLQGLLLKPDVDLRKLLGQLRSAGLLLTPAGGVALRFTPPLVVTEQQLSEAVELLDQVLGDWQ